MEPRGMFWIFTVFILAVSFPGADALSADVAGIIAAAVIVAVIIIVIVIVVVCYFMRTRYLREEKTHCVHCKSKEVMGTKPEMYPYGPGPHRPYVVPVQTVQTFYAPVMPPRPQPMLYIEDRRSSKDSSVVEEPKEPEPEPEPEPLPDTHQPAEVEIQEKVRQYEVKTTSLELGEDDLTGNISDEQYIKETVARVGLPPKPVQDDYIVVDYVVNKNRNSTVIHNLSNSMPVSIHGSVTDGDEVRDEIVEVIRTSSTPRSPIVLSQSQIEEIEATEIVRRQRLPAKIHDVRI